MSRLGFHFQCAYELIGNIVRRIRLKVEIVQMSVLNIQTDQLSVGTADHLTSYIEL